MASHLFVMRSGDMCCMSQRSFRLSFQWLSMPTEKKNPMQMKSSRHKEFKELLNRWIEVKLEMIFCNFSRWTSGVYFINSRVIASCMDDCWMNFKFPWFEFFHFGSSVSIHDFNLITFCFVNQSGLCTNLRLKNNNKAGGV